MLKKLIKYDMKAVSPVLFSLHAAILFFCLLSRLVMSLFQISPENMLASMYIAFLAVIICAVSLFTDLYLGIRYYRNLYTDEGYLSNTLPVSAHSHVLSKTLCGFTWMAADLVCLFLCLFLLIGGDLVRDLKYGLSLTPDPIMIICALLFFTGIFTTLLMVYCAVAIGNLFHGHRVMGCIGGYIILYLITQLLGFVILLPLFLDPVFRSSSHLTALTGELEAILTKTFTLGLLLNIILGIIYYIICVKFLDKKLELD